MIDLYGKKGLHPEVAVGIPFVVITAKPNHKPTEAKRIGYTGPLTLVEAIEQGMLSMQQAKFLVSAWLSENFGHEATHDELAQWCGNTKGLAA
jgi:hypothetical protein